MLRIKRRIFEILQPPKDCDTVSKVIDLFLIALIFVNIGIVFAYTYTLPNNITDVFSRIETISVIIFTIEYLLRIWTADLLYEAAPIAEARMMYVFSWMALIDLLSIIPFYLPMLIPFDLKVLRIIRVFRLLQIFKLTRYTTSLMSIYLVLKRKAEQLISAFILVFILITIASLIMYNVENPAQPEIFRNAFSGMWWAVATLTTVGYGDIFPITALGKVMASIISILGIGLIAVPTAIISTGFIEQVQSKSRKKSSEDDYLYCPYCGKMLHRHHFHSDHHKQQTDANSLTAETKTSDNLIDSLSEKESKQLLSFILETLKNNELNPK